MKWLIITDDYDLYWTDDDKVAKEACEFALVYNAETKQQMNTDGTFTPLNEMYNMKEYKL